MTEDKWLTCADPKPMLEFLIEKVSDRKLRLFSCACCRRNWRFIDEKGRGAVEAAEEFADGAIAREQLDAEWDADGVTAIGHAVDGATAMDTRWGADWAATNAAEAVVEHKTARSRSLFSSEPSAIKAWAVARLALRDASHRRERIAQVNLLRDIFRNPFRPVTFDPSWRTLSVVSLAQTIYDNRSFDKMPELGDAFERAGCRDQAIIDHCRQPSEHVRGCWVVDLVLGKE